MSHRHRHKRRQMGTFMKILECGMEEWVMNHMKLSMENIFIIAKDVSKPEIFPGYITVVIMC